MEELATATLGARYIQISPSFFMSFRLALKRESDKLSNASRIEKNPEKWSCPVRVSILLHGHNLIAIKSDKKYVWGKSVDPVLLFRPIPLLAHAAIWRTLG